MRNPLIHRLIFFCHFVLLSLYFAVNYIKILLRCCVRCPVTPFGFAGLGRGPGWESPVPWADRSSRSGNKVLTDPF